MYMIEKIGVVLVFLGGVGYVDRFWIGRFFQWSVSPKLMLAFVFFSSNGLFGMQVVKEFIISIRDDYF